MSATQCQFTINREIFAVKIFCQLLRRRKLNTRKVLTHTFNFRHLAMWQKLNVTFLMQNKGTRKFPDLRYYV